MKDSLIKDKETLKELLSIETRIEAVIQEKEELFTLIPDNSSNNELNIKKAKKVNIKLQEIKTISGINNKYQYILSKLQ